MPATQLPNGTLTLSSTFDLMFIGGRRITMDYPCAKFSAISALSRGQTERQTESHTHTHTHTYAQRLG